LPDRLTKKIKTVKGYFLTAFNETQTLQAQLEKNAAKEKLFRGILEVTLMTLVIIVT